MRVRTFMGKVGVESLQQMDDHINAWLKKVEVEPKIVNQTYGTETHRQSNMTEPVVITQIWY